MPTPTRTDTRERLLDAAERLVNRQGFAASSIDQILEAVGVTKGTFFYHFKNKNALALALIERFAARDQELLETSLRRAEKLSDDPRQRLLIFAGLLVEIAEQMDASEQPGCLYATYCWESGLFDEETKSVIENAMLSWRHRLAELLRAVGEAHPPKIDVDPEGLADMANALFEGAFVLARTVEGRSSFTDQLRHYRNYLQLLYGD